jgi:hypothetical protein
MKDAQKPDHVSLNTLVMRLKEGRYVIPDFQRDFEWRPWDIRELLRSIFLDYYIGSLLLWKGKRENFEALTCQPIHGFDSDGKPEYIVLDGQQRLTAMYYAFAAPRVPLPHRSNQFRYFIRIDQFMDEAYDEAFHYEWFPHRIAKVDHSRELQYEEHLFPISVVGAGGWELGNWIQGYERFWADRERAATAAGDLHSGRNAAKHAENARAFGAHLKGIIDQYQISYIELDQDLEVDKVCDIFTQINSRGIRLDAFDLINALIKPRGLQLKLLWRQAAPRLEFVDSEKMNVYVLQVMSILRQAYCSPKYLYFLLPGQERSIRDPDGTRRKEILIADVSDFERRWHTAVNALENAIALLRHPQEFGAISPKCLPYVSILPVFAALQSHVETIPPELRLEAQRKLRQWYWASVFTNRYSGSVESTSARDFLEVKSWISDDTPEPGLLLEFKTRSRDLNLRAETKRGTSVYNGIFNLFVLQGARDWVSGKAPRHDDLDDHHIVPKAWGKKHLNGSLVDTILNRTPLTADTNRTLIRDRLPNEYLRELIDANGESAIASIMESHSISRHALEILLRDPFGPEDFEAFISERQRVIQDAIEGLLIKARLSLPPNLRELDAKIEAVELGLRKIVAEAVRGDPNLLPPHIRQRASERVQQAARRNPAMDPDQLATASGVLEFCTLAELQDLIVNKSLWSTFEGRFASREALEVKFAQLAEIRNRIRHSRAVDEIALKEGEAAILWFERVLAR